LCATSFWRIKDFINNFNQLFTDTAAAADDDDDDV